MNYFKKFLEALSGSAGTWFVKWDPSDRMFMVYDSPDTPGGSYNSVPVAALVVVAHMRRNSHYAVYWNPRGNLSFFSYSGEHQKIQKILMHGSTHVRLVLRELEELS